jgi:hypothetical protein
MSAAVRRQAVTAITASSAARMLMGVDSVLRESVAREEREGRARTSQFTNLLQPVPIITPIFRVVYWEAQ